MSETTEVAMIQRGVILTDKTERPRTKVLAALVKAQGAMEAARKDAANPHFGSKFADLASVAAAIKEPFAKNGLGWRHKTSAVGGKVSIRCVIFHESGEELEQESPLEIMTKGTAQDIGSALSYGRRYTLQAEAGLVADDDDGNAASGKNEAPPKRGVDAIPRKSAEPKAATEPNPNVFHVPELSKFTTDDLRTKLIEKETQREKQKLGGSAWEKLDKQMIAIRAELALRANNGVVDEPGASPGEAH